MVEWWHEKTLAELSPGEWEALCDGCARCCLHKLQDEGEGTVQYTSVRCRLLDEQSCRCGDYSNRLRAMPDCVDLRLAVRQYIDSLPSTCAYRLRARGERLADWHPLVSGAPDSVHFAGISVRGRTISEENVHPDGFDEFLVQWVD